MRRHRLTLTGVALSSAVYFLTLLFDLDLFEQAIDLLASFEAFEVDELILPLALLTVFFFFDFARRHQSARIEVEKSKIYRSMLHSTHHIMNNFLSQMQLFKVTADETPGFDPQVLTLFDRIIDRTSEQIDALSNVVTIDEAAIRRSVLPNPQAPSATPPE